MKQPLKKRQRPDDEKRRVLEKRRVIPLHCVPCQLEYPAKDKQRDCPPPIPKNQQQRNNDQRNADRVERIIDRVAMASTVFVY